MTKLGKNQWIKGKNMPETLFSRVDKLLALTGISRTEARKIITAGRVAVSGVVVRDPGAKAAPDQLTLDGQPLSIETDLYLMLNKPAGVVTATEDKHLPTVVDLLPEKYRRRKLGPVGRLDRDVTGLVLLTTDGELAHRLISPKWKAEKTYRAVCSGPLSPRDVDAFRSGIALSDFTAQPAQMNILSATDGHSVADVTLTEGKFHQVKRMFIAIGHPLTQLQRIRIGCVKLDPTLAEGDFRPLTPEEIQGLKRLTSLEKE